VNCCRALPVLFHKRIQLMMMKTVIKFRVSRQPTFCRWHCNLEMASLVCCTRALKALVTQLCWFQMSVAHAFNRASSSPRSFIENSRFCLARSRFSCVNCCQLAGTDRLHAHHTDTEYCCSQTSSRPRQYRSVGML